MPYRIASFKTTALALAGLSLMACSSTPKSETPQDDPVKEELQRLKLEACQGPEDLMRPTPRQPLPRISEPEKGIQLDEAIRWANRLADWGNEGWNKYLDWQVWITVQGPCVELPKAENND